MARTLVEFHGIVADMLVEARRRYDERPAPGEPGYLNQASQDAVTTWRRMAHLVSGYANGAAVRGVHPTWEAFWADGMDRSQYLKLIARRSRIVRTLANGGDLNTSPYGDSVRYWECGLAREVMNSAELVGVARKTGKPEVIRRIELDHDVTVKLAMAYTGVSQEEIGRILDEREGEDTMMAFASGAGQLPSHPMIDLISANRPTF